MATATRRLSKALQLELIHRATTLLQQEICFIHSSEFENLSEEQVLEDAPERIYGDSPAKGNSRESDSQLLGMENALLTPQGEQYLFCKLNFLKYQANALRSKLNPLKPKKNLIEQIERNLRQANEARTSIVEANLRLVASIAHKFSKSRLDYEEWISEGNMILVNAVDKFDYSRGFRFSTYATHAVQRHFYRQLQKKQKRKTREVATSSEILSEVAPFEEKDQPLDQRVAQILIDHFETCLDEREIVIIKERFGLSQGVDGSSETLKAVALKVGLSKERVRQLQMRAIDKLQDLAWKLNLRLEPTL